MSIQYKGILILVLLSVVLTGACLKLLPKQIPMHWNLRGEVDRFGSKYELILLTGVIILMGIFFLILARHFRKKQDAGTEKAILATGLATLAVLNALFFTPFLWNALTTTESPMTFGRGLLLPIGLGITLVVAGNLMPKSRLNGIFGLRTSWSMANDEVWRKSQRFGGITMFITGLIIIIAAFFVPDNMQLIIPVVLISLAALISVIASYVYYVADQNAKPNKPL